MRTTIDRAGRLVIPREIRRQAGLAPGMALEVRVNEGRIEIAAEEVARSDRRERIVEDRVRSVDDVSHPPQLRVPGSQELGEHA